MEDNKFVSSLADCKLVANHNIEVPLSVAVAIYAVLILGTTLLLASSSASKKINLKELGLRPHGKNLWEWWWSYNINAKNGPSGIPGYDPILGSFDPSSRAAFHTAAILGLWAIILRAGHFLGGVSNDTLGVCKGLGFGGEVVPSAVLAVGLYAFVVGFVIHNLLPGVSKPGGPRPHKIRRSPKWKDGRTSLPESDLKGWTFLTAEKSHRATSKEFDSETILTGEAAGRHTWFSFVAHLFSPSKKSKPDGGNNGSVDESLVQEMALGGRPQPGFEPSVNPNSNDQIFRAQQIRNYL
eukprot:jgi/Psemu1/189952/e_gw1.95.103.1